MSKALFISGGGTKIPFLGAVTSSMMKDHGVKVDHIVGVSAGAILSLPLAMGMFDEVEEFTVQQKQSDIFVYPPNTIAGKINSLWNIMSGETHMFDDSRLRETIQSVITLEDFKRYRYTKSAPDAHIMCVDIETGEEIIVNLKKQKYEDAISYVMASAAIPMYVSEKTIGGRHLYDGGLRSHIASLRFLKMHPEVKKCISVYSRSEDLSDYRWEMPKKKWFSFRALKVLSRVIEIMNIEISKSDEYLTDNYCEQNGIKQIKIFAPFKLSNNPYETGEELNQTMWDTGIETSKRIIYNGFTDENTNNGFFDIGSR